MALFFILFGTEGLGENFTLNRVIDGDTFEVIDAAGKTMQIDLAGIDAPELPARNKTKGQPFSQKALQALSDMILNKVFSYTTCGQTVENHILAVVYSEEKNINLEMVKAGLAEAYRGPLPTGFDITPYKAAEEEARKASRNIWALGSVYISPIVWRKAN